MKKEAREYLLILQTANIKMMFHLEHSHQGMQNPLKCKMHSHTHNYTKIDKSSLHSRMHNINCMFLDPLKTQPD